MFQNIEVVGSALDFFLFVYNLLKMSVQTEKSLVIDLLQNINDISLLKKVKAFVLTELNPSDLTQEQKNIFQAYLRYPYCSLIRRIGIILFYGFSLGGSRLSLIAKTLLRRPIEC